MQYLLLLHVDESGWGRLPPEEQSKALTAYGAYGEALNRAGAVIANGRLAPSEGAKTIQTKGGRLVTTDGPFAESKEVVAGFYLIDAPGLEAAMDWAGRCPAAAYGAVEVRQLWAPPS